jgi:uncharacterized Tic20 family protein
MKGGIISMIFGMKPNTYCMLLHLSQLLVFLLPGIGFAVPIVLWAIKDKESLVNRHGKIVLNWLISFIIYGTAGIILATVGVGIIFLKVLLVLLIVFPIVGGIRANDGIEWQYPLSIRFFK